MEMAALGQENGRPTDHFEEILRANEERFKLAWAELAARKEFEDSTYLAKIRKQYETSNTAFTLFSDIDGTYIFKPKDDSATGKAYAAATRELTEDLACSHTPLAFVTGRDRELVTNNQQPKGDNLPYADILCTDVGTTVWIRQQNGTYVQDDEYRQYVENTVGYRREAVYPVCSDVRDAVQSEKPELKLEFQDMDLPGSTRGLPYKISFRFDAGTDKEAQEVVRTFEAALVGAALEELVVLLSHDSHLEDGRTRFNIDVLPFTKDTAVSYMACQYGTLAVVAGDSGNDALMLLAGDSSLTAASVMVGGAKAELLAAVDGIQSTLYCEGIESMSVPAGARLFYQEKGPEKGPVSLLKAWKKLMGGK